MFDPVEFARAVIEALPEPARRDRLAQLRAQIDAALAGHRDWDDYWARTQAVIDGLKAIGHDLWSHDYDGERRALWGWDYMRPEGAGKLQIEFDHQGTVRTFWRGEDARLGASDEDEA